jgi:hypothetical protein
VTNPRHAKHLRHRLAGAGRRGHSVTSDATRAPSHRRTRLAVALALATTFVLALAATPAQAATFHAFSTSFGASGSGAGQVSLVSTDYTFTNPAGLLPGSGLAVNSTTHDVYVADTGNHRVDQFSAAGTFIRAWGWGVADGTAALQTCTATCQAGISGSGPGQFASPVSVAIDNSTGDLYLADTTSLAGSGTNLIQKFDSSGNLITAWASGGQLDGSAATDGPFAGVLAGIAVDPSGNLFVNDLDRDVFEFASDGTAVATVAVPSAEYPAGLAADSAGNLYRAANGNGQIDRLDPAGNILGGIDAFAGASTGFAVDLSNAGVYSGHASTIAHFAIDASGNVIEHDGSICPVVPGQALGNCSPTDSFGDGNLSGAAGLAVDPSNAALFAADPGNTRIDLFTTFILPDTTTNPASPVGPTTATLNGHLDPAGGGDVSDCHFQYTDDASFQSGGFAGAPTAPCAEGNSFSAPADVHADLTGLSPQLTYHFRLLATDPQGTNTGGDQPFATAPAVAGLSTDPATNVGPTSATLNGSLDPAGHATTYHFQYTTSADFAAHGYANATTVPVPDADAGSTPGEAPVTPVDLTGLSPGTGYTFRIVATNTFGTTLANDQTFATPPRPSIDAAFASNLTTTDADLNALINPNGFDTTYRFEYGTADCSSNPCTSVPVPDADIGSGTADVSVTQHLTGLTGDTTYHWRILATNANGTVGAGVDHTFVYATTGQGLPDGRAYEQVTPAHKNGALIGVTAFGLTPEASQSGTRVIASTLQCFADARSCSVDRQSVATPFAFNRTPTGWQPTALAPPATQLSANTPFYANVDSGTALFTAPTPPTGQDDWYARQPGGTFADLGPSTPPAQGPQPFGVGTTALAATPDLSHLVWGHVDGGWPFAAEPHTLYQYSGPCGSPSACQAAQPLLVGVGGPNDGPGSTDLITTCRIDLGATFATHQGDLSADGRTVFFTADRDVPGFCSGGSGANAATPVPADALYARVDGELPTAHTVPISERSPAGCSGACLTSPPGDASFLGASDDASKVYFASTQQLTDDATQDSQPGDTARAGACIDTTGPNGCNLYLYDFSRPAGHRLIAVSAGDTSGNGPRVQGPMALSPDGSHLYFVAHGVLTAAPNAQGQSAADGADNLYLYDATSGDTSFIAALPASDGGNWDPSTGLQLSNVTPDGRFLVFQSHGALTPDATSQSGAYQVFRYDASTGELIRISIGEGGFNDNGNRAAPTPCSLDGLCSEDASIVRPYVSSARTDPTLSHDGTRVFFMSPLALTPRALDDVPVTTPNGQPQYAQNVYEWHAGHVSLISDGRDASKGANDTCQNSSSSVCLIGASGSGQDVFFSTADQLVPQDGDTELDFYDARVGGGFPHTPPPVPCQGDNCKPPPSGTPPNDPRGSGTASGPGNQSPVHGSTATKKKCKKRKKGHHKKKCKKHSRAAKANREGSQ